MCDQIANKRDEWSVNAGDENLLDKTLFSSNATYIFPGKNGSRRRRCRKTRYERGECLKPDCTQLMERAVFQTDERERWRETCSALLARPFTKLRQFEDIFAKESSQHTARNKVRVKRERSEREIGAVRFYLTFLFYILDYSGCATSFLFDEKNRGLSVLFLFLSLSLYLLRERRCFHGKYADREEIN